MTTLAPRVSLLLALRRQHHSFTITRTLKKAIGQTDTHTAHAATHTASRRDFQMGQRVLVLLPAQEEEDKSLALSSPFRPSDQEDKPPDGKSIERPLLCTTLTAGEETCSQH